MGFYSVKVEIIIGPLKSYSVLEPSLIEVDFGGQFLLNHKCDLSTWQDKRRKIVVVTE